MNYTINISLPEHLADQTKQQVKQGRFASVSEVIRAALRDFFGQNIPIYKMSKKAERSALKARKDYLQGKAVALTSVDDLDKL